MPWTEVDLALNWFPEIEHGGYYAALVHGLFEAAGLKVKIIPGGNAAPTVAMQSVALKRVPFGITSADQLLTGRAGGMPIRAVFAPLQLSPRCLMVHEKSGIRRFEDLHDLTLAVNENSTFGTVLRKRLPLPGCRFVPYPGNVVKFLQTEAFAQQGYVFSEPLSARREGGDPLALMAADIGFNPYTSLLIVHEDTIRAIPGVIRRMVGAVRAGWQHYLAKPDETNRHIQTQHPEISVDVLAGGVAELRKLCITADVSEADLGQMTAARWTQMLDLLVECGVIEAGKVSAADAFTTEFLAPAAASQPGPGA